MTKPIEQTESNTKEILLYHWRTAMRQKKMAVLNITTAALSVIVERYLAPLVIAYLLSHIQTGTITLTSSAWMIAIYVVVILLADVAGYRLTLFLMWTIQVRGAQLIYKNAYKHATEQSMRFFNDTFAGSLVSQVNKIGNAFISFWNIIIYKIVFIATSLVATLVGIGLISWPYTLIVLVLTIAFAYATYYGNRALRPYSLKRSRSYSELSARLSDSFSNILTVKIESNERFEHRFFDKTLTTLLASELNVRNQFIRTSTVYSSITAMMKIGALVASIALVQQHVISAGLVYLCLVYTFNLLEEIWNINSIMRDYHQIIADSEDMIRIMQQKADVVDKSTSVLQAKHGELTIDTISFGYGDQPAFFENFSLTIPAKQKVGLVGVSGSGKTTLTKLIMRFMDTDSGTIAIDGTPIDRVSQRSLRRRIAYVPQEPLLFHRTLRENIQYSDPKASEKAIKTAAERAQALDFITSLPDGFDTLVGERGVKLSGGQRQRVAIARAILKDAPIVILDEATSALDSESEHAIQAALSELWQDKTAIVVAHRLSTIAKLDRIIVLDHGRIIEDGTHKELLARGGTYATLWNHQSGGFIEE